MDDPPRFCQPLMFEYHFRGRATTPLERFDGDLALGAGGGGVNAHAVSHHHPATQWPLNAFGHGSAGIPPRVARRSVHAPRMRRSVEGERP
jgi:hypothetical protein